MTTKPSPPQAGVLSDYEIERCIQVAGRSPNIDAFPRAIEQAVLAKQAQAPTEQSGEVDGLLKEADEWVAIDKRHHHPPLQTERYILLELIQRLAEALRRSEK